MIQINGAIKVITGFVSIIILTLFNSGCSVIGLTIGAAEDNDHPRKIDRPVNEINMIDTGADAKIAMKSGESLDGKYAGIGQMSQPEYESIFPALIEKTSEIGGFPAPGDTVIIYDKSGNELLFILDGYNAGYLSVRRFGEEKPIAILTRNIFNMLLEYGETISGANLETMIESGKLPTYRTIILDVNNVRRIIPADSIVSVTEFDKNNRKWKGFAIGAVLDLAILTLFIYSLSHMQWDG